MDHRDGDDEHDPPGTRGARLRGDVRRWRTAEGRRELRARRHALWRGAGRPTRRDWLGFALLAGVVLAVAAALGVV